MSTQQMSAIIVKSQPFQNEKKSHIGRGCDLHFSMNLMHRIITGLIPSLDQQH